MWEVFVTTLLRLVMCGAISWSRRIPSLSYSLRRNLVVFWLKSELSLPLPIMTAESPLMTASFRSSLATFRITALIVTGIDIHLCKTLVTYSSEQKPGSGVSVWRRQRALQRSVRSISAVAVLSSWGCSKVTDMYSWLAAVTSKM